MERTAITQVTVARTNLYRGQRRFEVRITSSLALDDHEIAQLARSAAAALGVDPSHVAVIVPSTVDATIVRSLVEQASRSLREHLDAGKPDGGGEIAVTMQHEP